ncbi:hypothetical protein ACFV9C_42625 [Kribbella sp. NPDC059898]|uniref:hypothetical protein n=1 Tax=Kribbella sp. NPDC059898 TaxID=3346995 RepID=UPI003650608E
MPTSRDTLMMPPGTVNALRIRNDHLVHDHSGHPVAPPHPQALTWAYELVEPAGRVYGIDADAILAAVIDDYQTADPEHEKAAARARHAHATALILTAQHRADHQGTVIDAQVTTLRTPTSRPVTAPLWDCPVPLVLVDVVYAPFTSATAPIGNVRWLHSRDADSYLQSLCEVGAVTLHRAGPS